MLALSGLATGRRQRREDEAADQSGSRSPVRGCRDAQADLRSRPVTDSLMSRRWHPASEGSTDTWSVKKIRDMQVDADPEAQRRLRSLRRGLAFKTRSAKHRAVGADELGRRAAHRPRSRTPFEAHLHRPWRVALYRRVNPFFEVPDRRTKSESKRTTLHVVAARGDAR